MDGDAFDKLATRFASAHGKESVKELYDNVISGKDLAPVRDDPSTAVALLQSYDLIGLSTGRAAQALDVILGEIPDASRPGDVLADNLTPGRINELLRHMDGVFSTSAYVANVGNVVSAIQSAIAAEAGKPAEERRPIHPIVLSWAQRLKERPDYLEILGSAINRFTFRDWLLISIWAAENFPSVDIDVEESNEPIPVGRFAHFGIDESAFGTGVAFPLDLFLDLQDLIDAYRQGEFAPETVEDEMGTGGGTAASGAYGDSVEEDLGIDLDGDPEEDLELDDEESGEGD